jgi:sporulation protein YlmC with PRC-barrel domain
MKTLDDVQTWRGLKVVDAEGDKIGKIADIYLDRHTGEPAWATVKTGLFGTKVSFVPIRDAEKVGDDEVRVNVQEEQVKDAPRIEADGDELSEEDERRLYEHYGRSDYDEWQGQDRTSDLDLPAETGGRFERAGGDAAATPALVGVRLRRYVVITGRPQDDES